MLYKNILLTGMSLAWASNYVFISWTDHGLPPMTASAAITMVAALSLILGVRLGMRRPLLPTLRQRPQVALIMAVTAVALPQLSVIAAENAIRPELAAVIGTTVPILTFIVTAFVLHTVTVRLLNLVGIAVAFFGIVLFCDPSALLNHPNELKGIAFMTAGGVVFVANGIYAR